MDEEGEKEEVAANAKEMAAAPLPGEPSTADALDLPGFRFHPTDEELVGFYLRRRVERRPLRMEVIKQMDIYKYDPWELPVNVGTGEERYFFCQRGRKYRNSVRPNRVTASGFWKATGIDRSIYSSAGGKLIGLKKSLVYYMGSAGRGSKTDWMMHEFRLPPKGSGKVDDDPADDDARLQEAEVWTVCRVFKRNVSSKRHMQALKQEDHCPPQRSSPAISCSMDSGIEYEHKLPPAALDHLRHDEQGLRCTGDLPNPNADQLLHPNMAASKPEDVSWEELMQYW